MPVDSFVIFVDVWAEIAVYTYSSSVRTGRHKPMLRMAPAGARSFDTATEFDMRTSIATDAATSTRRRRGPAPAVEWSTSSGEFVPIPAEATTTVPDQSTPADAPSAPTRATAMAELMLHEKSRYRAAAEHARRIYPGPLGELVHRELTAYAEFGYRMAGDGLIPRLTADVLATTARPPTSPFEDTAPTPAESRPCRSSSSSWPPRRIRRGNTR